MKIKIAKAATDNKWAVYFDDSPDPEFYFNETELQELISFSQFEDWAKDELKGIEFGRMLFNLLNRGNTKLQRALDELTLEKPLDLLLYLPRDLSNLPFELLYYNEFIALKTNVSILRMVSEKGGQLEVKDRALKVLFVATSAIEYEASTLNFEQEEEKIIEATKKYPVDFQVEDTGSLEGIENMLWELKGVDILHISGHAGHDMELGPVFYMEDEVGNLDKVTPERLFQAIKDICPTVLFLSGCSTGKRDNFKGSESLAFGMAQLGVPIVLSWGLPVSDSVATRFASAFYEKVAKGLPISYAVNEAQLLFKEDFHPWPLMRLFSSGAKPGNLVTQGQGSKIVQSSRRTIHKRLEDSEVQILDKGFVGRRRDLQKANAVLKNTDEFEDKYGLIIRGPAGVGKSCLAGRAMERQTSYDVIVFKGELTEAIILYHLTRYFDRNRIKTALEILKREEKYEEKVKDLYREVFSKNKVILYFDEFEQNLKRDKDSWYLKDQYINAFMPFLEFIDIAENQSKIVITSRYPFELQAGGKNLSEKLLVDLPLISFIGVDENKKIKQLTNISKSKHIELYKQFGHGNPRLIDWLETIAANENKYDIEELNENLKRKEQEYIREYQVDIIAEAEGEKFKIFLKKSAVYRLPVEASAFEEFGEKKWLEKGVDLTLFEKESQLGRNERYWVMPVIQQQMFNQLSQNKQQESHKTALLWYDKYLEEREDRVYLQYHQETVFHALSTENIDMAAKHIIPLGEQLNQAFEYKKQQILYKTIIDKIDSETIEKAKRDKSQSISTLFNDYGTLLITLGNARKAVDYLEKGKEIYTSLHGNNHQEVAAFLNNIGNAALQLGDLKKAVKYYREAIEIELTSGNIQENIATYYNNLGLALRDLDEANEAIEYLKKGLDINLADLGDKHPSVATSYSNVGLAFQDLGDAKNAVDYINKALKIDLAVYGPKNPKIAIRYTNLGGAYCDLHRNEKAIKYLTDAKKIFISVYSEKHHSLAFVYKNLGNNYRDKRQFNLALKYYKKALKIELAVSGLKSSKLHIHYSNLGHVWKDLGNAKKAIENYQKALKISKYVHEENHKKVLEDYRLLANAYCIDKNFKEEKECLIVLFNGLSSNNYNMELKEKTEQRIKELDEILNDQ